MGSRSKFKRSVLFTISVHLLMSLAPLESAHAGPLCDWLLSPFITKVEKWKRAEARDPDWRPKAKRYYARHTDLYQAATDPGYWYLPGNVAYDEAAANFPHFVSEYQFAIRAEGLPDRQTLVMYRKEGRSYRPPEPRRSSTGPSVKRTEPARRSNDDRRPSSDDDSPATGGVVWDSSSTPSPTPSIPEFEGRGGSSGGAGASGDWSPAPSHAPSHSHSHAPSHTPSHDSTPSPSPSDSGSSSSSSDSGSSSSGSDGGGGGGGGGD